jgi:tetratricopeptide (TPR) repeat protein
VAEVGLRVAEGLDHAHRQGVIHRDVKPSNLLLDDQGKVWVADFGLARLETAESVTGTGHLVGTLRYMAPEQVRGPGPADHRVDVYGLGATLYELLTLCPAFPAGDREGLLSQITTAEPAPPRRLDRSIPADLETVVLRAMARDPADRYATAGDLADDLRRFLEDRPVLARRPGRATRVRRWARRHRPAVWGVGIGVVGFLALTIAGLVVSNVLISRQKAETDRALRQAQASAVEAERQRETARANLRIARTAVDEVYEQFAGTSASIGRYDRHLAQQVRQKTLAFYEEFARLQETDPDLRFAAARAQVRVGDICVNLRQLGRAEEALVGAVARLDGLEGEVADLESYRRERARACHLLGYVFHRTHRDSAAVPVFRRAVELLSAPPVGPKDRDRLARVYIDLGDALRPDFSAAERAMRTAIEMADRLVANDPAEPRYEELKVRACLRLGTVQMANRHDREAEITFGEVLALLDHPTAGWDTRAYRGVARLHLARVLEATGRTKEAEPAYDQAINLLEPAVRESPLEMSLQDLLFIGYAQRARLLEQEGRIGEATDCHRRAVGALTQLVDELPTEDAYESVALASFASFSGSLATLGEQPEREDVYRGVLAAAVRVAGKFPSRPGPTTQVAHWQGALGSFLTARGRPAEAEVAYRQALAGYRAALDFDPKRVPALNNLAWLLATCPDARLRDPARAVELATRATELAPQYAYLWNTRGVALYRAGEWEAAKVALDRSMALYAGRHERDTLESFNTFFLAMSHARLGNGAEARRWYDRGDRWTELYRPADLELRRFRAEATEVVGRGKDSGPTGR